MRRSILYVGHSYVWYPIQRRRATARIKNLQARLCSYSPAAKTIMMSRIPARNSLRHFLRRRAAMFRLSTIRKPPTDGTLRSELKYFMTTRLGLVGEVRYV